MKNINLVDALVCVAIIAIVVAILYSLIGGNKPNAKFMDKCIASGKSKEECEFIWERDSQNSARPVYVVPLGGSR